MSGEHQASHTAYTHGCRCDRCVVAHREYTAQKRAESLSSGRLTHGKGSTYDAGCRCVECKQARRLKYRTGRREYPAARREAVQ